MRLFSLLTKNRVWWKRVGIAGLILLLLGSVALNGVLVRMLVEQYREEQRVRLDPTASAQYGGEGAAPVGEARRIVLFGDSRILQWRPFAAPGRARVVNRGVGDETTAQALLRVRRDVVDQRADLVVIQSGVNDLKAVGVLPERAERIERDCVANLRGIVEAARAGGADVILLTIFPVGPVSPPRRLVWSDRTIDAIDRVNQELKQLAGPGVTVLDCDPILRRGRRIRPEYAADQLHLNRAGYAALAGAIGSLIEDDAAGRPAGARR